MNHSTPVEEPSSADKAKYRKTLEQLEYKDIVELLDECPRHTRAYHVTKAKIKELKDKAWLAYFKAKYNQINRMWIAEHKDNNIGIIGSVKAEYDRFMKTPFTISEYVK